MISNSLTFSLSPSSI